MKGLFSRLGKTPHIALTAIFFVIALAGAGLWNSFGRALAPAPIVASVALATATSTDATSTGIFVDTQFDPVSEASASALIELQGAYAGLKSQGVYDASSAADVATQIGLNLHAPLTYEGYIASQIRTEPDTSKESMLAYRKALQGSAEPLLENKQSELKLFGLYTETKDASYLDQLRAEAANYRAAASSTAQIVVPADAVAVHLGILNAMVEFAGVLDSMADHAQDPIGSVLLLQNYNQAESDMYSSFDALASYFKDKAS